MMIGRLPLVLLALALAGCGNTDAPAAPDVEIEVGVEVENASLVLASVGPIHTLLAELLRGTDIEAIAVPEPTRSLAAQPTWFARQSQPFHDSFSRATAVVGMSHVWRTDPLFQSVREQNIRVVNIDATLPYSSHLSGLSILESPETGAPSPYFWLSPANLVQSSQIISIDLQRLFPQQADLIRANEQRITATILAVKRDFELALLEVDDPIVYSLASEFDYLTNEFGIFVGGSLIKQDINWTDADLAALTDALSSQSIGVVIHKWEPSEAIVQAISAGGAKLVVLEIWETQMPSLDALANQNPDLLIAAFKGL